VLSLITTIAACFFVEILWAKPSVPEMITGLVPRLDKDTLYLAVTILGATVMPHNMYLHSALVQTRTIGHTDKEKRIACRYNLIDSVVALNGALLVNAAILVMSAAVFFKRGVIVTEIQQAHLLLAPLLGTGAAGVIFAVALLCSGQSSTLTGTMAGQVVMEGFLNFRMQPWLRRMITRAVAVVPAALTIYFAGEESTLGLLLLSQAILSLQLPFAIVPLIQFTNDRKRMGPFANKAWVRALAWLAASTIIALNILLAKMAIGAWIENAGQWRPLVAAAVIPLAAGLVGLLAYIVFAPLLGRFGAARTPLVLPDTAGVGAGDAPVYHRILLPLDHTALDRLALSHGAAMAKLHGATLFLLHVEEGVTSVMYGDNAATAEVEAGEAYLDRIAQGLRDQGVRVETAMSHSSSPKREIVRYAREIRPDLVIMGAHGHGGLKDLIFGNTINPVRHDLKIPMLIVRPGKP
jgi:manganese transport protein